MKSPMLIFSVSLHRVMSRWFLFAALTIRKKHLHSLLRWLSLRQTNKMILRCKNIYIYINLENANLGPSFMGQVWFSFLLKSIENLKSCEFESKSPVVLSPPPGRAKSPMPHLSPHRALTTCASALWATESSCKSYSKPAAPPAPAWAHDFKWASHV